MLYRPLNSCGIGDFNPLNSFNRVNWIFDCVKCIFIYMRASKVLDGIVTMSKCEKK